MEEKKVTEPKKVAGAVKKAPAKPAAAKKPAAKKTVAEKLAAASDVKKADADHVAEIVPEMMKELGFEDVKAIARDDKVLVNINLSDIQKMAEEKEQLAKEKEELKKAKAELAKATKAAAKPAPAKKPVAAKPAPKPAAKPTPVAKPKPEPKVKKAPAAQKFHNRLHEQYVTQVMPKLMPKYKNVMAVPRIEKVVINMGLGDAKDNTKSFAAAMDEIGLITGQKPVATKARKSISNFKLREGQKIGAKVTLRGANMYLFLDKLISVALPRVRDFRGISAKSFDQFGNYAFGIKEQLVFPEISYEKIEKVRGFDIAVVTTAKDKADCLELLQEMGFPFRKEGK